ncbi:MAG: hypothetical protein K0U76_08030 [Actinomycetia bacterium]|nr:hypothetical protein [Actinomycetes bacterium]MCH9701324.1 hypothetical protein [Actinomycetes bacterium]MCH9759157.1 hypothetical protein [Actinomycetes bacterium]
MFVNTIRTNGSRLIAGAFAAAAVVVPLYTALSSIDATPEVTANPGGCLAWFGNKDDGNCMGQSNNTGFTIGSPNIGLGGPFGVGIYTSPLLPGTTITREFG